MSKKKQKRGIQTLITLLICAVLLFYVGYQAYRSVFADVDTELAVMHSVYETIDAEGLVYRTETLIPSANSGYPYFAIGNGTRVAKNSVIASVYGDKDSGRIKQQIEEIDAQINALSVIEADGASGRLSLDNVNSATRSAIYDLIRNNDHGTLSDMDSAQFDILSLLSKKQLVTGKSVDFSKKIKQLQREKKLLESEYRSPKSKIYAPVAGYFADHTDGFEKLLKTSELEKLSVNKLQSYFDMEAKENEKSCGKIVSGYEWFMACILPDHYYNVLGVGKSLSLRMSLVMEEAVPATVYACNKDGSGNMVVVFRCDYMSVELSTIRRESVQIQLVEHNGLKVPKRAIIIDENQQAGVYVRSGNVVSFRKIEQVYSEPAEYSVCAVVDEEGYLRMYDDIIVGGKDLYDGKIIR